MEKFEKPDSFEEKELMERCNIIGWYDGRPLEILPLLKEEEDKGLAASASGHEFYPDMQFAAHKDGEFAIVVDNKEIRLDISFDDPAYY